MLALVVSTGRRLIHSSCSFFISYSGAGPSQESSRTLNLQARGGEKRPELGEEQEKERGRYKGKAALQQAVQAIEVGGVLVPLSALPCNIPPALSLLCILSVPQRILLSSVGLLILPSDLWVVAVLYIPALSRFLQTQTPYLIRFSPWLRQTEIGTLVYLYCSGARV